MLEDEIAALPLKIKKQFDDFLDSVIGVWFQLSEERAVTRFFLVGRDDLYYSVPSQFRVQFKRYALSQTFRFGICNILSDRKADEMYRSVSGSHYSIETIHNHMNNFPVTQPSAPIQSRFNFDYNLLKDFSDDEGFISSNNIPGGTMHALANGPLKNEYGGLSLSLGSEYMNVFVLNSPSLYSFINKTSVEPFEV